MNILHFCSYFCGSKVYENLFLSLKKISINSDVYIPIKKGVYYEEQENHFFVSSLSTYTRVLYFYKLFLIYNLIYKYSSKFKKNDLVHAHTLYSDGVAAYIYAKKNQLDLIVTIRTTDVGFGFKYYIHYKWLARKALAYAKKVVFVAPAHKTKFQRYFGHAFDSKLVVIPNGVDKYYLNNTVLSRRNNIRHNIALYVGAINKNKNIQASITAFFNISTNSNDKFKIVGGTYKEYVDTYGELPHYLKGRVIFLGKLPKELVLEEMRTSTLFIMVSHNETFGLVYIEAISQCLPLVYTEGQGIDGYFENGEFGYCSSSNNIDSISEAILKTITNFPDGLVFAEENPIKRFSWESIANIYKEKVYK